MAAKDVVKDVRSAGDFEQQLLISYAQKGVVVLDVYSSEWGPCKAINDTFKHLFNYAGDNVHLRFLSVECNSVLASLKDPQADAAHTRQRPKNTEAIKDALPEFWEPVLAAQQGKSKPFFVFYKEGKKVAEIEGVDTPAIRAIVNDLCTVKTPASDFITNPRLQEFWEEHFSPEESDVAFDKFIKAVQIACAMAVNLNDDEKRIVLEAIGLNKETRSPNVTADALQKWFGDDEAAQVGPSVKALLPDYDERAAQVMAEREADEQRRKDDEEKAKADAAAKEEEEQRQKDEQAKAEREAKLQQIDSDIADAIAAGGFADEASGAAVEADAENAAATTASTRAAPAEDAEPAAVPEVAPNADEAARVVESVLGVWAFLEAKGAQLKPTSAARTACDSAAAFALKLLSANAAQLKAMTNAAEDIPEFRAEWGAASVASASPLIVSALGARRDVAEGEELFVKAAPGAGEVVLAPMTPLLKAGGDGLVPIVGVPSVLPMDKESLHDSDAFVCVPWFTKVTVGDATADFLEFPGLAELEEKIAAAADDLQKDDAKLTATKKLRAAIAEREELNPSEKKDEAPPAATEEEEGGEKKADDNAASTEEAKPAEETESEKQDDAAAPAGDEKKDEEEGAAEKPAAATPEVPPADEDKKDSSDAAAADAPPKADTPADENNKSGDAKPATPPAEEKSATPTPADEGDAAAKSAEEKKSPTPAGEETASAEASTKKDDDNKAAEEETNKAPTPAGDDADAKEQSANASKPATPAGDDSKPADDAAAASADEKKSPTPDAAAASGDKKPEEVEEEKAEDGKPATPPAEEAKAATPTDEQKPAEDGDKADEKPASE